MLKARSKQQSQQGKEMNLPDMMRVSKDFTTCNLRFPPALTTTLANNLEWTLNQLSVNHRDIKMRSGSIHPRREWKLIQFCPKDFQDGSIHSVENTSRR